MKIGKSGENVPSESEMNVVSFIVDLDCSHIKLDTNKYGKDNIFAKLSALENINHLIANFVSVFRTEPSAELIIRVAENFIIPSVNIGEILENYVKFHGNRDLVTSRIHVCGLSKKLTSKNRKFVSCELFRAFTQKEMFDAYHQFRSNDIFFNNPKIQNIYDPFRVVLENNFCLTNFIGSTNAKDFEEPLRLIFDRNKPLKSILDVGCGSGFFYYVLSIYAQKNNLQMPLYVGLDLSARQITHAKKLFPDTFFRICNADNLPFLDSSFDVVVANSVLQFLPCDRVPVAITEMLRVSRFGAWFSFNGISHASKIVSNNGFYRTLGSYKNWISQPWIEDIEPIIDSDKRIVWSMIDQIYSLKKGELFITGTQDNDFNAKKAEIKKFKSPKNLYNKTYPVTFESAGISSWEVKKTVVKPILAENLSIQSQNEDLSWLSTAYPLAIKTK